MPDYFYDLHIHSCLSPCGDPDMTPNNIAGMAYLKGLDMIALTDHNSARNCPAMAKACQKYGISFVPGLELCTSEEIHVLCLFPQLEQAMEFGNYAEKRLIKVKNNPSVFGNQFVVNENDETVEDFPYLLVNACNLSIDEAAKAAGTYGGIAVPAHIDRPSFSILASLGEIPSGLGFLCYELNSETKKNVIEREHPVLAGMQCIQDSDAHFLNDIAEPVHSVTLPQRSADSLIRAFSTKDDRKT